MSLARSLSEKGTLRHLCDLGVSAVSISLRKFTAEGQRTLRMRRENDFSYRLLRKLVDAFDSTPRLRHRRIQSPHLLPVLVLILFATTVSLQERRVDDPEDQEDLNRELWEFARQTPYDSILPYLAQAQRQSKTRQSAAVELPDGWRIAPAGVQVEVGRLPYEAILFA